MFKANDGQADSPEYTVTLSVTGSGSSGGGGDTDDDSDFDMNGQPIAGYHYYERCGQCQTAGWLQ